VLDGDMSKHGSLLVGHSVVHPSRYAAADQGPIDVVVVTSSFFREIATDSTRYAYLNKAAFINSDHLLYHYMFLNRPSLTGNGESLKRLLPNPREV
jgi:hypothetical protein